MYRKYESEMCIKSRRIGKEKKIKRTNNSLILFRFKYCHQMAGWSHIILIHALIHVQLIRCSLSRSISCANHRMTDLVPSSRDLVAKAGQRILRTLCKFHTCGKCTHYCLCTTWFRLARVERSAIWLAGRHRVWKCCPAYRSTLTLFWSTMGRP